MKQIQANKIIVLNMTFCPPAAVVLSSLKKAKAGEVLHIKAAKCHAQLVTELAERVGAEVVLKVKEGACTNFWIVKR